MSSADRGRHIKRQGEQDLVERLDEALFSMEMLATPETIGRTMQEVLDWHTDNITFLTIEDGGGEAPDSLVGLVNFGLDCITGAVMTEIFLVSGSLTRGIHKAVSYLNSNSLFHQSGTDMVRLAGLKIKPALQQLRAFPFVVSNPSSGILHLPVSTDAALFVKVNDMFVPRVGTLCGSSGEVFPRSSAAALPVHRKPMRRNWQTQLFDAPFVVDADETFCVECSAALSHVEPAAIGAQVQEHSFLWV